MASIPWLKCLNGEPYYIIIEERNHFPRALEELNEGINHYIEEASKRNVDRLIVILQQHSTNAPLLKQLLLKKNFVFRSRTVVYRRELETFHAEPSTLTVRKLGDIPESRFMQLWEQAMSGSINKPSTLAIEEQFLAMKQELGVDYKKSCCIVEQEKEAVAVIMPHIEPGTAEEGRLFYFGILPQYRGMRLAATVHQLALKELCNIGASYYIGSTDERNAPMIRTFEKNGCEFMSAEEQYVLSMPSLFG